jgi:phosphate transport system substrate-binding protein
MVFQQPNPFALSIYNNVAFGLRLNRYRGSLAEKVEEAIGNEGVATRIRHSVGAIGYVGYEFDVRLGLKTALLENREGRFIRSTPESCTAALATAEMPENLRVFLPDPSGPVSYPIVTFTWILLYRNYPDAEKVRAVRDFFRWCLDEGQRFAPKLGYVQRPASVREKAQAALQTIGPRPGP